MFSHSTPPPLFTFYVFPSLFALPHMHAQSAKATFVYSRCRYQRICDMHSRINGYIFSFSPDCDCKSRWLMDRMRWNQHHGNETTLLSKNIAFIVTGIFSSSGQLSFKFAALAMHWCEYWWPTAHTKKKYILNKQNTEIKTEMSTTTRQNEQHIISGFVLPIKTSRAWNISIIFCLCLPRQFAIPKIVIVILGIQKKFMTACFFIFTKISMFI